MVDDEGDLVHYVFYENTELVDAVEVLKDSKWMKAMVDEIKFIKNNDIWPLVELPKTCSSWTKECRF